MKQNIYVFSNSILKRKNNTLCLEQDELSKPIHEADIDEEEILIAPYLKEDGKGKKYIPADNVEAIYTFGTVKFNNQFLSMMSKNYIPIHIFNYYGKYTGSFLPKQEIHSGNIAILQVEHYNDDKSRVELAKGFILGAAKNALANLLYYKYRNAPLEEEIERIKTLAELLNNAASIGEIMGLEGNIKSTYYRCWQKFLKQEVEFEKRVKRPPDNLLNSLISYGNVILYSVCLNEIIRTGLLPSIGYLHSPGDNRTPLSFDLSEVFKPVIVDKCIFRMLNLNMIDENDCTKKGDYTYLKDKAKKAFIECLENRLKTTVFIDSLKRNVSYKTLIRLECHKIIKHLKGEGSYEAFESES